MNRWAKGEMMKILIVTFLSVVSACTSLWASESTMSEFAKVSVKQRLAKAAKSKQITQQQYTQALSWVDATPCEGVARDSAENQKTGLVNVIKKQLQLKEVDVIQRFGSEGWFIVYVDTHVSDEPYLFYSSDPLIAQKPVTEWSGAATIFETSEIEKWVLDNAPGIPKRLAACFAWCVTLNRDWRD